MHCALLLEHVWRGLQGDKATGRGERGWESRRPSLLRARRCCAPVGEPSAEPVGHASSCAEKIHDVRRQLLACGSSARALNTSEGQSQALHDAIVAKEVLGEGAVSACGSVRLCDIACDI